MPGQYRGNDELFRSIGERVLPLDPWTIDVGEVMGNRDMVVPVSTWLRFAGIDRYLRAPPVILRDVSLT